MKFVNKIEAHSIEVTSAPAGANDVTTKGYVDNRVVAFDAGGDASAVRPAGAEIVHWYNVPSEPVNIGIHDLWESTEVPMGGGSSAGYPLDGYNYLAQSGRFDVPDNYEALHPTGGHTLGANRIYPIEALMLRERTISQIYMIVQGTLDPAATNTRVGLYSYNPDGSTKEKLFDINFDVSATGVIGQTLPAPVTVPAGWYAFVIMSNGTPTLRYFGLQQVGLVGICEYAAWRRAGQYTAWADPWTELPASIALSDRSPWSNSEDYNIGIMWR